ncbi:MAG: 16S rRNA (adenine(1518)-N(6)/adenine(1519)-N(6))-dimethyltransferase RsmA [Helicobacteraceae bacterium]|nr:16S rRNA (adenine(1518)-N(6)/adenine(1519)-N(6))-dimethyltransferase RsmA [Helicobacteraceae bacterium]
MIRAKKRFGQHFLIDRAVVRKIIEATPDYPKRIVEIGPGLGDLTEALLAKGNLTAIEIDAALAATLQKRFAAAIAAGELTLLCADALEAWENGLASEPYAIVANLPYYAATEIILRALRDPLCKSLIVMTQLEMAQKFCATRNANSLSLLVRSIGSAELLFEVSKEAFEPAPKVESAVIRIVKTQDRYDEGFSRFLKTAFKTPRKRLASVIQAPIETLEAIGIGKNARAHELSLEQFKNLYKGLKNG